MSKIPFSDGVEIEIDGPLRKFKLSDGWYVAGEGTLTPCVDEAEADDILKEEQDAMRPVQ